MSPGSPAAPATPSRSVPSGWSRRHDDQGLCDPRWRASPGHGKAARHHSRPHNQPGDPRPIGAAALSESAACSCRAANPIRRRRPDQSGQGPRPAPGRPGARRRRLSCCHGIRASGDGRNRPANEVFRSHPLGETDGTCRGVCIAMMLIAESSAPIINFAFHLRNLGLYIAVITICPVVFNYSNLSFIARNRSIRRRLRAPRHRPG